MKKKYQISTVRLQSWDYGASAAYFITICTQNRAHFFGEIIGEEMHLNELGILAAAEWEKTIILRPDMNLELGEFVVMPNHFHGIIIIGENEYNTDSKDIASCISTHENQNSFAPQSKNLAAIIRGFKSAVTTNGRQINKNFNWQSSFYDNIIRTPESFDTIQNYIATNPANWKKDKFYTEK